MLAFHIIAFIISRYYYVALRLQGLFLFLLYLYTAIMVGKSAVELPKGVFLRWSLVFAALISSASRLKNFDEDVVEIGRASCRERVCQDVEISVVAVY